MGRRHAAEVPRITSRSKLRSPSFINVLGSPNPFAQCPAPKFAPEKTELRYHTASQIGQLLHELRKDRRSYFGHLSYHLATALFFTGCRYHEWALLTIERLVREPGGVIIAARLQVKGGSFRDLPLTTELSDSLEEWFAFLESVKPTSYPVAGLFTVRAVIVGQDTTGSTKKKGRDLEWGEFAFRANQRGRRRTERTWTRFLAWAGASHFDPRSLPFPYRLEQRTKKSAHLVLQMRSQVLDERLEETFS